MKKVRNEFMPVWENIKISPSEELADQLMDVINKYGINNQPKIWNELRGIWFVVNECPEISTAKKSELRNFLMTKGLRLDGRDKDIIDNYKYDVQV